MEILDVLIVVLLVMVLLVLIYLCIQLNKNRNSNGIKEEFDQIKGDLLKNLNDQLAILSRMMLDSNQQSSQHLDQRLKTMGDQSDQRLSLMSQQNDQRFEGQLRQMNQLASLMDERMSKLMELEKLNQDSFLKRLDAVGQRNENQVLNLTKSNELRLEGMNQTIEKQLTQLQQEHHEQMEKMRHTVDEKLQDTLESRITKSFQLVSERLEQVYKGLGEMQTLANGVGDLKRVLSNVKTRGILGEIQLGAILEEILSPEQYETNFATVPNSRNVVEYALKLPGDDERSVYLPIDSKFPLDVYARLMDAYDNGDNDQIQQALKNLDAALKSNAKDIHEKYIEVPYTTDFGIMFLPIEGLYAEAVRRGLVETLQREYKINIAGPTTMAALPNSLQMGFKTLAIQKRSGEVWEVLGAVKTEFGKFEGILESTQNRLQQVQGDLEKLVGVRTRQIRRKLSKVTSLEESKAVSLLDDDGQMN